MSGAPTSLTVLISVMLCLLGHVGAVPQSGTCRNSASNPCSLTGGSSTYSETIVGDVRQIRAGGCPNNNPLTVCIGDNPNPANTQNWALDIPATPKFVASSYEESKKNGLSLKDLGGIIGITRNGVEIRGCWGGGMYGIDCVDYESSANFLEGDTFEYCGGHGNPYHYHQAPVCLLQQMGPGANGSSPHIGWAVDGFPIYGNRGPNGVLIKRCGAAGADPKYCADECGGYYGSDWNDEFLYRYFLMGPDGDLKTNPITPSAGPEYFPFAPYCLVGCGSVTASGADTNPSVGRRMNACESSSSAGTAAGYSPIATPGVTVPYQPVPQGTSSVAPSTTTTMARKTTTETETQATTTSAMTTTRAATPTTTKSVTASTVTLTTTRDANMPVAIVKGKLDLRVSDANAFLTDDVAEGTVAASIAEALGVPAVDVALSVVTSGRAAMRGSFRQKVSVDYSIVIPESEASSLDSVRKNALAMTTSRLRQLVRVKVFAAKGRHYSITVVSSTKATITPLSPNQ